MPSRRGQYYGLLLGMMRRRRGTQEAEEESTMTHNTIIGVDLAKHVFQVYIVNGKGALKTIQP
jgi:hypothetical protein